MKLTANDHNFSNFLGRKKLPFIVYSLGVKVQSLDVNPRIFFSLIHFQVRVSNGKYIGHGEGAKCGQNVEDVINKWPSIKIYVLMIIFCVFRPPKVK